MQMEASSLIIVWKGQRIQCFLPSHSTQLTGTSTLGSPAYWPLTRPAMHYMYDPCFPAPPLLDIQPTEEDAMKPAQQWVSVTYQDSFVQENQGCTSQSNSSPSSSFFNHISFRAFASLFTNENKIPSKGVGLILCVHMYVETQALFKLPKPQQKNLYSPFFDFFFFLVILGFEFRALGFFFFLLTLFKS
jgi:hypothetical protein